MIADATDLAPPRHADDRPHERHKAIDGWRAVAAGAVVVSHALTFRFADPHPGLGTYYLRLFCGPAAELGVQLFFVISGYIITSLLLREQAQRGRVSIAAFYARRICRIMPPLAAYYVVVVALAAAGQITLPTSSLASSATFTCNTGIVDCEWWVAHTWSLAVEEQFYLGWPLLFGLVAARMRPRLLLAVLAGCTLGVMAQGPVSHGNFTSFACIAAGALYATSPLARRWLQRAVNPILWAAAVAAIVVLPVTRAAPVVTVLLPLLVTYAIFAGNALDWVRWVLETRPLQVVGLGSYSLYLWQQLFLAAPWRYDGNPFSPVWLPLAVIASVLLVERPFIKLGRRLSRAVERPAATEGTFASGAITRGGPAKGAPRAARGDLAGGAPLPAPPPVRQVLTPDRNGFYSRAASASTSAIVTTLVTLASGAMRLIIGPSTLPPNSTNSVTPAATMASTDSRQRTMPVTCATSATLISPGVPIGAASTLQYRGTSGPRRSASRSAFSITSAADCISGQ